MLLPGGGALDDRRPVRLERPAKNSDRKKQGEDLRSDDHGHEAGSAHFFAGFFKTFYGEGLLSKPVSDEVLEWARDVAMMASVKATLACAQAFATTDFRGDLPSLQVPTLIIHGTSDKTVPIDATGRASARAIRQAQLIEYDGAPHGLFATHKERLTSDLLQFLRP